MHPGRGRSGPADGASQPPPAETAADTQRHARRRVVCDLVRRGIREQEILRAIDEDRLPLLLAELALTGERRYDVDTVARRSGLGPEVLQRFLSSSGLPPDILGTAGELRAAMALYRLLHSGLPEDALMECARVVGQGLDASSRAMVLLAGETFVAPEHGEDQLADRWGLVAEQLSPQLAELIDYQLRRHLVKAMRAIGAAEIAKGPGVGARDLAVAFADLSGFTRLGHRLDARSVGRVAHRLSALAQEACAPPVIMVKAVGDSVMLVSAEPLPLVTSCLALVSAVDAEGSDFPRLRAGIAWGPAAPAGGDWFGHAVNLASRVAGIARPGAVVATSDVVRATAHQLRWSRSTPRHLRGVRGLVRVARLRA